MHDRFPTGAELPALPARITISDVALKAGVSKATVSRFLNRREELLTPEIATRVEQAIAALGYTPSPMAQALKRGRSRLIGLVVADVTNPFSVAVLRGAERACQEAGYLLMLFNLGNESGREREAIEALSSYQVEGLILNTLGRDDGAAAPRRSGMASRSCWSIAGTAACRRTSSRIDNAGAVRLAATHLVGAGYRELLFVSEPVAGVSSRVEREAAFRAFIADRGDELAGRTFESTAEHGNALEQALRDAARTRRIACAGGAVQQCRHQLARGRGSGTPGVALWGRAGNGRVRRDGMGAPDRAGPEHDCAADRRPGPAGRLLFTRAAERPGPAAAADPAARTPDRAWLIERGGVTWQIRVSTDFEAETGFLH